MHILAVTSPLLLLLASSTLANPINKRSCTSAQRLAGVELIPYSYNLVAPGASAASFETVPFADDCHTYINANGLGDAPVAIDRTTTINFAIASRQIFSQVTGTYTDNPNGDTVIHTNVTLGALHSLAIPVTFYADVHCYYNLDTCLIEKIDAIATIPTVVAGVPIDPPILPQILALAQLG